MPGQDVGTKQKEKTEKAEALSEPKGWFARLLSLKKALEESNWEEAQAVFKAGLKLLEEQPDDEMNVLYWTCVYEQQRFFHGASSGIENLKQLAQDNPTRLEAFAVAEFALNNNPQLGIRFSLGLAYHSNSLSELGLYHFKTIHDMDPENAGALHNLALLSSECDLPITSVKRYKAAFKEGETLSAANLGYKYLESGMHEQANEIILSALKIDPHDPQVDKCYADIIQRDKNESGVETERIKNAKEQKQHLVQIGTGLEKPLDCDINGTWSFPVGLMELTRDGTHVTGLAEVEKSGYSLAVLMDATGLGEAPKKQLERHELKGDLRGSVLFFETQVSGGRHVFALPKGTKGVLVFNDDGKSGTYMEIKENQLEKVQQIEKSVPAPNSTKIQALKE